MILWWYEFLLAFIDYKFCSCAFIASAPKCDKMMSSQKFAPLCFLHRVSLSVPLSSSSSSSLSLDSCLHQPLSLFFSTFLTLSPTLSVPSLFFHLMLSSYFHKRCSYFNSLTTSYAFQGHWLIYPPLSRSMGSGRDFFYLLLWRLTFSLYPLYYTVPH